MELALVKALLLLGVILLVGGGMTATLVAPELTVAGRVSRRRITWGAVTGAGLLLLGSALDIVLTLLNALGRSPSNELTYSYLTSTRHGHAVLVRTALVGLVLPLTLWLTHHTANRVAPRGHRPWLTGVYLFAASLLFGTFSYTSHAAAMGGTPPFIADLAHFAAATVWAGPLLYLALVPDWEEPYQASLQAAFKRVSFIGLLSVLTLFATGIYTTLIHLQEPVRFATSTYGFALYIKLALVLVIVGLATVNRFWLLPAFLHWGAVRFKQVVRLEGVLLVAVLVVTGILTTSALPHGSGEPDAWANLIHLLNLLKGRL